VEGFVMPASKNQNMNGLAHRSEQRSRAIRMSFVTPL